MMRRKLLIRLVAFYGDMVVGRPLIWPEQYGGGGGVGGGGGGGGGG
ncbi:unnamed protein product, partial [Dibothriocephalus latus]